MALLASSRKIWGEKNVISVLDKQRQIEYRKGEKFSHFIVQIKYNHVTKTGQKLHAE